MLEIIISIHRMHTFFIVYANIIVLLTPIFKVIPDYEYQGTR